MPRDRFLVGGTPSARTTGTNRHRETALQTFSPREIQARVRGGESAEVVAAETGWPLDKVLRYAEPLLAERAFIAEQAQAVEVRRSGGGATLLEAAYQALGADPEAGSITWDAYRREDGKWIVTGAWVDTEGSHLARWTYDHGGRNLHPLDDDARTLMGARPVAVPDPELDIAEALDLVADIPVVREAADVRPHLVAVPDAADDEAEDGETADDETADELPLDIELPLADDTQTVAIPHPAAVEPTPEPAAAKPAAPAPKPKAKAKRGRASVPSWDEILFGATKHDD